MRRRNCTLAARRTTLDRAAVEKLWMTRAKPVDNLPAQIFFRARSSTQRTDICSGRGLRDPFRLIAYVRSVRSTAVPTFDIPNIVTVHRFEETIGGRSYYIEVTPVSNRWRAQLRRMPGMPTAMMPFYGTTPDEAARLLTKWLMLAHSRLPSAI